MNKCKYKIYKTTFLHQVRLSYTRSWKSQTKVCTRSSRKMYEVSSLCFQYQILILCSDFRYIEISPKQCKINLCPVHVLSHLLWYSFPPVFLCAASLLIILVFNLLRTSYKHNGQFTSFTIRYLFFSDQNHSPI